MDEMQNLSPERTCALIRDLLPLYAEDMLSPESRQIVEVHLATCPACAAVSEQLRAQARPQRQCENVALAKPLHRFRWIWLLNILGAPLWLPLLLAVVLVALALYISLWAVILSLWCVPLSLGVTALACLVASILGFVQGQVAAALLLTAAMLVLSGLTLIFYFLCLWASIGVVRLTALIGKALFGRKKKEAA